MDGAQVCTIIPILPVKSASITPGKTYTPLRDVEDRPKSKAHRPAPKGPLSTEGIQRTLVSAIV